MGRGTLYTPVVKRLPRPHFFNVPPIGGDIADSALLTSGYFVQKWPEVFRLAVGRVCGRAKLRWILLRRWEKLTNYTKDLQLKQYPKKTF